MADNPIRDELPFQEQCVLIDNMETVSEFNVKDRDYRDQKRFTLLTSNDPALIKQKLTAKKDIENLLDITPAQLSLLVPKIRVFKVAYDKDKKPIERELVFNDFTGPNSISDITKNRIARGEDAGILSFTYELDGKNPAEGGTAKCTLKLFFQNVKVFTQEQEKDKAKFIDLVVREPYETSQADPKTGKIIKDSRKWNDKHFRIKIETGWSVPVDPKETIVGQELKRTIEKSGTILFLTLLRHTLDFKENGTLELELEYRGAMESALSNPSADLFLSDQLEKKGNLAKALREETGTEKYQEAKLEGNRQAHYTKQQDALQAEVEEQQIKYAKILEDLFSDVRMRYFDIDERVLIGLTEEQRESAKEILDKDKSLSKYGLRKLIQVIRSQNRRLPANQINITKWGTQNQKVEKFGKNLTKKMSDALGGDKSVEKKGGKVTKILEIDKRVEEVKKALDLNTPPIGDGKRRINFFYLGDLLNVAFKAFDNKSDAQNMKFLLGPVVYTYPIPVTSKEKENIRKEIDQDAQVYGALTNQTAVPQSELHQAVLFRPNELTFRKVVINLADVPISFNMFMTWYISEVIAKQRPKYYANQFITDVLTKLVIPALGEECYGATALGEISTHISMNFLTVPALEKGLPPLRNGRMSIDDPTLKEIQQTTHSKLENLYSYLFIYIANFEPNSLDGNMKEDFAKGIYHFALGADRGLVRGIKFNKIDQPYVGEMRATANSDSVKKMRERYNATMTMFGNNLFSPGLYVFIDPRLLGGLFITNSEQEGADPATRLGLGGYYQIRKVTHHFSKNSYETELDLQWISDAGTKQKLIANKVANNEEMNAVLVAAEQIRSAATSRAKKTSEVGGGIGDTWNSTG